MKIKPQTGRDRKNFIPARILVVFALCPCLGFPCLGGWRFDLPGFRSRSGMEWISRQEGLLTYRLTLLDFFVFRCLCGMFFLALITDRGGRAIP